MDEFDKNVESIKNKFKNVKLSDEKKEKLKNILQEELDKPDEYIEIKNKRKFFIPRPIAVGFAACVLLTTGVFADQIGDYVDNLFANTYQGIEESIENGNVQKIDMDYVEHDGVSIKVDYVIKEEDSLIIAFNVLSEDEFDDIVIGNVVLKNRENIIFYDNNNPNIDYRAEMLYEIKAKSKNNKVIILKIENIKYNNEKVEIIINDMQIYTDNELKTIVESFEYKIKNSQM